MLQAVSRSLMSSWRTADGEKERHGNQRAAAWRFVVALNASVKLARLKYDKTF
jgi:hypothetical protein